jgi:pimeloyl-ACP methyl ester carboxylesterase
MYFVRGGLAEPSASKGRSASKGPSAGLLLTEPIRGLGDHIAAGLLAVPGLLAAPRGDGHGVLVFPGLLAGDGSTVPLRGFLRWLGYRVRGWDLGRNHGPTEPVLAGLPRALFDHAERTGRPVSLVGWSLGGIYARELARRHPHHVRQVITLGSPYARANPSARPWSRPIRVPSTSVYSRLDGVVAWQTCIEPETATHQNVEVRCSHLGFGVDPATLWLIADRLAVPAGQRVPFRPPLALRPLYPPTGHPR